MARPCWGRRAGGPGSWRGTGASSRRSATAMPTKPGWRCAAIWKDHATACLKARCWTWPCRVIGREETRSDAAALARRVLLKSLLGKAADWPEWDHKDA